jgi:hypothetical protein
MKLKVIIRAGASPDHRHESAALTALTAGLFAALACSALALAPIWLGFLVGYSITAGLAALECTVNP